MMLKKSHQPLKMIQVVMIKLTILYDQEDKDSNLLKPVKRYVSKLLPERKVRNHSHR